MEKMKIVSAAFAHEKAAIAKAGVGTTGTLVSAHDIQIVVGIATLIFMLMQIVVMVPKVQSALRQMAAERERKKIDIYSDVEIPVLKKDREKPTLLDRVKRFFNRG